MWLLALCPSIKRLAEWLCGSLSGLCLTVDCLLEANDSECFDTFVCIERITLLGYDTTVLIVTVTMTWGFCSTFHVLQILVRMRKSAHARAGAQTQTQWPCYLSITPPTQHTHTHRDNVAHSCQTWSSSAPTLTRSLVGNALPAVNSSGAHSPAAVSLYLNPKEWKPHTHLLTSKGMMFARLTVGED